MFKKHCKICKRLTIRNGRDWCAYYDLPIVSERFEMNCCDPQLTFEEFEKIFTPKKNQIASRVVGYKRLYLRNDAWSNGHILEFRELKEILNEKDYERVTLNKNELTVDMINSVLNRLDKYKFSLLGKPDEWLVEFGLSKVPVVIWNLDDFKLGLNAYWYFYFIKYYPGCEFFTPNVKNEAVKIRKDGKLIGLIMPLDSDEL